MKIAQSVAGVLRDHVTLEVEGIDRMYLNVYVPGLQFAYGVVRFFREHRQQPWASSALMSPMSRRFVGAMEQFIEEKGIEMVPFRKGERKDDVITERLKQFTAEEGIVFIGKAQKKVPVFRTEKRRNPRSGQSYPWIVLAFSTQAIASARPLGPSPKLFRTSFPSTRIRADQMSLPATLSYTPLTGVGLRGMCVTPVSLPDRTGNRTDRRSNRRSRAWVSGPLLGPLLSTQL